MKKRQKKKKNSKRPNLPRVIVSLSPCALLSLSSVLRQFSCFSRTFAPKKKGARAQLPLFTFLKLFFHTPSAPYSLFSLSLSRKFHPSRCCVSLSLCVATIDRRREGGCASRCGEEGRERAREKRALSARRARSSKREREREKGSESTSDEREGREKEKSEKKQNSCATCCVKKKKERTHTKKSKNISVLICRDTRQRQSAE